MDSNHQAIAGGEALCSPDCIWHQLLFTPTPHTTKHAETETYLKCSSCGICTGLWLYAQQQGYSETSAWKDVVPDAFVVHIPCKLSLL